MVNNKKRQDSLFKLRTLSRYWSENPETIERFYADNLVYYVPMRATRFGRYKVIKATRAVFPNGERKILYNKSKVKKI